MSALRTQSTSRPVSGWIRAAAYAVPLCVLPSALWRFYHLAVSGPPDPSCRQMGWFEPYYIALLSVVSLSAALLTIGLVRPWGEVFPRWIPWLGGCRVPVALAVVPASIGTLIIFSFYVHGFLNAALKYYQPTIAPSCPPPPDEGPYGWVVVAAYAPLLLWAPLLAVVTYAYYRRRRNEAAVTNAANAVPRTIER